MTMSIAQLIESASEVTGYDPSNTFSNKKFGAIYAYNKVVKVKPRSSIMEVTMMIKAVTDRILPAKEDDFRPVAAHKVMVSIRGVEKDILTAEQLIVKMRRTYKSLENEDKYPDDDVLARALDQDKKPFKDRTVLPQADGTYALINDYVKDDSLIRVWCSCSSYYWVFQYYNVKAGVDIWGKSPSKYIHKTKIGRKDFQEKKPMRNPGNKPGICKHILLLLALLMDSNTLEGSSGVIKQYRMNIDRFDKVSRLSASEYSNLIKKYKSDHRRKLEQRKAENWMIMVAPAQRRWRRY